MKRKAEQFLNQKFGMLTIERIWKEKDQFCTTSYAEVSCDCGNKKKMILWNVVTKSSRSCGCKMKRADPGKGF
jgi:hypothetical protein